MNAMRSQPSRPLRVAMISQGYYPLVGGAERQITAVSQELARRGMEVHVLTRRFPGLAPEEMISGVYVHRLSAPQPKALASLAFTFNALARIQKLKPDILHAHELLSPTTAAVAAGALNKIPVVATIHGGGEIDRLTQKFLGNARLQIFRSRVDRFIAIDKDIDGQLARRGIPKSLRTWIPNGVDVDHFYPLPDTQKDRLRAELHLPDNPLVVFTGRLVTLKRIDQLIAAWVAVRPRCPEATLLIIGVGPEEAALKQAASNSGLDSENGIRFLGEIQDVAPYLQAADLFVLPSSREGLSVSLLEAMGCGLATVATDVGGNVDLVRHQQTGWLVPGNGDADFPARLAAAMCQLLEDEPLRDRLGKAGSRQVVQSYSLASVVNRLQELYLDLAQKGTPEMSLAQDGRRK